jgi:hypothetical protein
MRKSIAAALLASTMLAGPVGAWTVTNKAANVSSSNANVVVGAQTYTAGSIIGLTGMSRGSTSADVLTLTGSVTGTIPSGQVYICAAGGSNNKAFIAWIYAAGGSETWTLNNSAGAVTGLTLHTFQIDGAASSSAEDAGARNCATAQGVNPSVSTATLAETGELVIGVTARIGSSIGYTEDAAWTQIGGEYGSTNLRGASAYKEALSTSPVTHAPTLTQSNNNIAVMAFKAATAPTTPRLGTLLGVQN